MIINDIYTEIKKFIETAISDVNKTNGYTTIEDTLVKIEIVPDGDEWTGIRLTKIPSASNLREFVNGKIEKEFNLQFISKQSVVDTESSMINYANYLDILATTLIINFRSKKPIVTGVKFKKIQSNIGSSLQLSDGKYTVYVLDVKFIYEI